MSICIACHSILIREDQRSKKNFVHSRIKILSHELQTINIYVYTFRIPHYGEFLKKQNIDNQVKTNLTNHSKSKNALRHYVLMKHRGTSRNVSVCLFDMKQQRFALGYGYRSWPSTNPVVVRRYFDWKVSLQKRYTYFTINKWWYWQKEWY